MDYMFVLVVNLGLALVFVALFGLRSMVVVKELSTQIDILKKKNLLNQCRIKDLQTLLNTDGSRIKPVYLRPNLPNTIRVYRNPELLHRYLSKHSNLVNSMKDQSTEGKFCMIVNSKAVLKHI